LSRALGDVETAAASHGDYMFLNVLPVVFFIASIASVVYTLLLARRMVTAVEQIARSTQRDVAD